MKEGEALWVRFETQLARRIPMLLACLKEPATLTELAETENELGLAFPDQMRFAYLRHNGSSATQDCPCFFIPGGADWLSLEHLREHWRVSRDIASTESFEPAPDDQFGKVRNEFWNPKRIPIGRAWGNKHLFPTPMAGTVLQKYW